MQGMILLRQRRWLAQLSVIQKVSHTTNQNYKTKMFWRATITKQIKSNLLIYVLYLYTLYLFLFLQG